MESEKSDGANADQNENNIASAEPPHPSSDSSKFESSEDEASLVVIDAKVDKIFKGEKISTKIDASAKKPIKSPRSSMCLSRSPDRPKSIGSSPVKIIKIKSPRNSFDSGKRRSVNLSRDNSKERSPDRYGSISSRRSSEGGILKVVIPNSKTDPFLTTSSTAGILKRNSSPSAKSRSPDRGHYRKSLSPGTSFESRSPDRNRLSPHSSFERRSPDRKSPDRRHSEYATARSAMRSPRSSFESRSPERDRKRSLSAHSSFDKPKSPEPYYHYYYMNQPQYQSPERKGKRLSKSLERTSSNDSTGGPYRYGLSPERIYRIGPVRSQSAENALSQDVDYSHENLAHFIEPPSCVECLYQRKPSQPEQKSRGRQSRARKKMPRGMMTPQSSQSLERSDSVSTNDGCVDCHEHFEIHV